MTNPVRVAHEELARIPLFRGLSSAQLDSLLALCQPAEVRGEVLFEAGAPASAFYLLTSGSVSLVQDGEETHRLFPLAVIGELGALTGQTRTTRAVVGDGYEVWQIKIAALRELFLADKDLALVFYQNLLDVVGDKIQRDQVRLQDMRKNIIQTQKDMKRLREFVLESQDTEVSSRIHEVLQQNIERNRRVNYRVEPPMFLPASLRLDSGKPATVTQISRTSLTLEGNQARPGDRISGVLTLSGPEIPVSGRVRSADDQQTRIELDLLLDEYAAELEGYLTRVQMLDFMV